MTEPAILGLDGQTPGIGWGLVSAIDGHAIACGWCPIVRDGWWEENALLALERTDTARRGVAIVSLVVERVGGGRGVQSMLKVADCNGILSGLAISRCPEATLWRPTPGAWKAAAGIGGNARKDRVRQRAVELLEAAGEVGGPVRQDAADALVMAHAQYLASLAVVS